MIISCIIILLILLIFVVLYSPKPFKKKITHTLNIINGKISITGGDGRDYYVLADKPYPQKASVLIEQMNDFMITFIIKLKQKYLYNHQSCFSEPEFNPSDEFVPFSNTCLHKSNPLDDFKTRAVYLLVTRYRPNELQENQPTSSADTSWTQGKGEKIALCLREQHSGKYEFIDVDLIKFVAIHELTHIAANTLQHPYYFWKIFKFLLYEANILMGYELTNYMQHNKDYCGMRVTYNPIFDPKVNIMHNENADITTI